MKIPPPPSNTFVLYSTSHYSDTIVLTLLLVSELFRCEVSVHQQIFCMTLFNCFSTQWYTYTIGSEQNSAKADEHQRVLERSQASTATGGQ